MSSHAIYAPSSAHRWTQCTASAEAIARLPEQEEGEAAAEGTAAHEEIERCLGHLNGRVAQPAEIGAITVDKDHDAAYGIALMMAYLRGLPSGQLWIEQRVELTKDIWGRCDVAHYEAATETLTIVDYKNGFVGVDAEENEQLRIYAQGSILTHNLAVKLIRYCVVQPRDFRPVPSVKQWGETAESLYAWVQTIVGIPNGPKSFVYGDHCRDCVLFGMCDPTRDLLKHLATMMNGLAADVPADKVALFLSCVKPIEHWFDALQKEHTKKAIAGAVPKGMKLVTSQTKIAWTDEVAAREAIIAKAGVDALTLPTPRQAEDLGVDISKIAKAPPGGPVLALESDKRKSWAPRSAAEMFKNVPGVVS